MKKLILGLAMVLMLVGNISCLGFAASDVSGNILVDKETIELENGLILSTETYVEPQDLIQPYGTDKMITASTTATLSETNGKTILTATLRGTFSYNGQTSKATGAGKMYPSTSNGNCKILSKSSKKSGNAVTGSCVYRYNNSQKVLTLKLTCSKNGTIGKQ